MQQDSLHTDNAVRFRYMHSNAATQHLTQRLYVYYYSAIKC